MVCMQMFQERCKTCFNLKSPFLLVLVLTFFFTKFKWFCKLGCALTLIASKKRAVQKIFQEGLVLRIVNLYAGIVDQKQLTVSNGRQVYSSKNIYYKWKYLYENLLTLKESLAKLKVIWISRVACYCKF